MYSRRQTLSALSATAALAAVGLAPREARAAPPRVQLLGDSMIAGGLGLFMAEAFETRYGCAVHRQGKVSTGLARPDFYDWIAQGAKAREAFEPDAVICMVGGNDGQGLYLGEGADPEWIRYGDPAWTPEYRRRINAFADAVSPGRERLFWIGMPQMRLPKLHARVEHMNTIFAAEMAIRPRARFLDIWKVLADRQGRYVDKMVVDGTRTRVRAADGVHLTRWGAEVVVDALQPVIAETLGLGRPKTVEPAAESL